MKSQYLLLKCLLVLALGTGIRHTAAQNIREELSKLDHALDMADDYVANHQVRLVTIENMLHSRGVSLEQQYNIYGQLYDAYVAFQFDKAMATLDRQMEIAQQLGDKTKIAEIGRAHV